MCPRCIDNAQEVDFIRKTAVIDRQLHRLNVDIAGQQETRLPDAGFIREDNYTFFWQGKSQDEPRLHGVGFAVKNTLLDCTVPPSGGTVRIIALKICSSSGTVNILNVYTPTLSYIMEEKALFYDLLSDRIAKVPSTETLYILGDFNVTVGSDKDIWPNCLGHHGVGKMNENGQRLLEVCCFYGLCITNTYFQLKDQHKVSWRHPRSHHWHQLDLVIARHIQKAADSGDAKVMYDGIKKAIGPTVRKTAPLKSRTGEVITDEGKQMERRVEHYLELYAAENEVSKDACDAIKQISVLEELDAMPTMEEFCREIDSLANGKAPGEDGIPAEVIKYNKSVLLKHLYSLITTSWEEGYVPMSMRNLRIVTLYKQKGTEVTVTITEAFHY
ncbi:craniofacial development protein 2-like [Schistocerca piceifrons]|uniref:craniofacial development protein 2-like n=1 Tax=Schistocerca piceifrons TaxID=274613 RepID=UPI001F5E6332|nr:craniofacial development protein 2-like [Schistocerca piceifrons]